MRTMPTNKYASCYICSEIVYLYKKRSINSTFSSNIFYKRRMAIVKNGFVLCSRCYTELFNKPISNSIASAFVINNDIL
ncbi:hypothetical protein [Lonomia obliqua multiple nucleopolyhedrovirus]|uniref:Uncharacterized protein n=1 Tax=Lonomia obliqua multiple nucleopolyhedrovirus TaxID=134394 RepID=A0A126FCE0_9ABAC|nr:hypothetical protein [Lonomia obliqua multiple nucleopolyhedrovirus]AKN81066.1 hypothetical protein [Lonomia obliqua multiple nucleopolyhedrovirus]